MHEREITKCVSLSTEGALFLSSPPQMPSRSLLLPLLLNDSDIQILSQEVSKSQCGVCVRWSMHAYLHVCIYDMIRGPE